ncbi:diguanylate cyclase [Heliobacterium gestii]|uniref:Diguanylate cyclase n=1 Tax=Heliomicrobium gestii TaxID=2699 RepID=A0A845LIT5_HELGE|nr:HD domain-containing phosphohydrolase [Heliomicrobium gestii]MBM7868288.1 diguanylate cyclase (GGDEF)-like protein [Heliomicrobium gestii]MZP44479.1 diguanylate cyclase [Heliomicrobium gestii]
MGEMRREVLLQHPFSEQESFLYAPDGEAPLIHESVRKSVREKQAVIDVIPDTLVLFDRDGVILESKTATDFETTIPLETKACGMNIGELRLPPEIVQNYLHCINRALVTGERQFYPYNIAFRGKRRHREARFTKVSSTSVLMLLRDVTEICLSHEQVQFLRRHDLMTGVYNRMYFQEMIAGPAPHTSGAQGIFMCDLDGLKLINDTLGHAVGDETLLVVATALRKTFAGENDVVARIGGDEFAVLCDLSERASLESAISAFLGRIEEYCRDHPQLPVNVSVGWAIQNDSSKHLSDVCKEAEHAMNRQKMHQRQSLRSAIVKTMMKALEARDQITEEHTQRLQELVEKIGRRLGLSWTQLADLRLFARFHDIGKVGIPDHILNKPTALTDEEYALMKRHSLIGYRIACESPDLAPISYLILTHHEWWDGRGYPLGIQGEAIPLECRILAIVDAFDVMTNDRPYRKAMSPDAAMSSIRRCSGIQFDPNLVESAMEVILEEALEALCNDTRFADWKAGMNKGGT